MRMFDGMGWDGIWCGVRFITSHQIVPDSIALHRTPYHYNILCRIISHQDISCNILSHIDFLSLVTISNITIPMPMNT